MKRRYFQIHLLTAVVGMLVASGFLWANTRLNSQEYLTDLQLNGVEYVVLYSVTFKWRGWPRPISNRLPNRDYHLHLMDYSHKRGSVLEGSSDHKHKAEWVPTFPRSRIEGLRETPTPAWRSMILRKDLLTHDRTLENSIQPAPPEDDDAKYWEDEWIPRNAVLNGLVALIGVLAAVAATEWFLRRREAVKK
jgi:hypothetical protein